MKNESKIYAVTVFLMLLLLISPIAGARHEAYSAAPSSDEGIHSFFSDVIRDAGICLDNFVDESPDADTRASQLESRIKLAVEESKFYAAKGFESNVSWVVQPFSTLSGGVEKIAVNQAVFLSNITILEHESDFLAYVNARKAVVTMRTSADEINRSLDRIAPIELWNETSPLLFNVTGLSEKLKDVFALISIYEQLLEKYKVEGSLLEVKVSDKRLFVYEEIMIYIYAMDVTSICLVIDNATHKLREHAGEQTKKYQFEELGEHVIYAKGIALNGSKIKSNIVKVYVGKIPTSIIISSKDAALVTERVKITGLLLDYYDKPLRAANVSVIAGDEETNVTTDRSGHFEFNATRSFEGYLIVSAFYPGSEIYNSSRANSSIFFSRFSLALLIEAGNMDVTVNETVNFSGSVSGISTNYTLPLTILADDIGVQTSSAVNDFEFSFSFSRPGTYEVYAPFPGDPMFKPANSNVVTITVTEKPFFQKERFSKEIITNYRESNILFYLFLLLIAIVSFFVGLYARVIVSFSSDIYARALKKKRDEQKKESAEKQGIEVANEKQEKNLQEEVAEVNREGVGFEEAYKLLFDTIISHYGFKKSLTPRELLTAIKTKNEPFTDLLEAVTERYEEAFYGDRALADGEKERSIKQIEEILRFFLIQKSLMGF